MQDIEISGHKGSGGGGGGKGGGSSYSESPNTLRSKAIARLIDLISEGPTEGVVGGAKGIYLDNIPLQNSDGSFNFKGVTTNERTGLPTQAIIPGFAAVETEISVPSPTVTFISSKTVTINDATVDAVRVTVGVNSLTEMATDSGSVKGSSVALEIHLKTNTGSYVKVSDVNFNGKTNSPYQRSVRVELPAGGSPWSIKVVRVTPDSVEARIQNTTTFSSYTEIVDAKLSYPDCALIGWEIDSELFGSQIRERTYKYRGLIMDVPTNYDPIARTYSGLWNGTFKQAWTNNPAWILYALITNPRFGLGDVIKASSVDKFGLYAIGQYCDGAVPNGLGGTEPRYTFNGVLRSREDAIKVLDTIASTFRGMIYWGSGAVVTTIDSPTTATKLVTPANVIGGNFEYTGSSLQTRCSSVAVTWNDPLDLGKPSVLVVQRDDLIQKFGDRRKDVAAVGCTSRGQAHRIADWLLFTEAYETELVTYQASLDHADVRPGQVISIADPAYAGVRYGGRLASIPNNTSLVLDAPITFSAGQTYSISVVHPDGSLTNHTLVSPGNTSTATITLTTSLGIPAVWPIAGSMWVITASNVAPRNFRVIANTEKKPNLFEITAMVQATGKYDYVERDRPLPAVSASLYPTGAIAAPSGLTVTSYRKTDAGSTSKLTFIVGWNRVDDPRVSSYRLWMQEQGEADRLVWSGGESSCEITARSNTVGTTIFTLYGVTLGGILSTSVTNTYNSTSVFVPPAVPTNWSAISGAGHIQLGGDYSPSNDFKEFVIYASNSAAGTYTKIDTTPVANYVRTIPIGDVYNYYKISAADHSGLESLKTAAIAANAIVNPGTTTPNTPTGISITSALTTGQQSRVVVNWADNTEANLTGYQVAITENGSTAVINNCSSSIYAFLVAPGTPITAQVRAVNAYGNVSPYTTIVSHTAILDTVPPAVPTGLVVTSGFGTFFLKWNANTDVDFARYEIYESTTITAPVAGTAATFTTDTTFLTSTGLADGITRNYWIRGVDTSGNKSAWSARMAGTTIVLETTQNAPTTPTGLSLATTVVGLFDATMTATFTSGANSVSYEIGVTKSGGPEIVHVTGSSPYTLPVTRGVSYSIRVRGISNLGVKSAWTLAAVLLAAADSVAPAVPTGISTIAGFGTLWVNWSANTDSDLSEYEVYESSTTTAPTVGTVATWSGLSTTYSVTGLSSGTTKNYWIRAVDFSGNKSAWSSMVSETTVSLETTQGLPAVPTGLSLSTALTAPATASLTVAFVGGGNTVAYEVGVTPTGGVETVTYTGASPLVITAPRNTSHNVRVRAVNNLGVKSAWTTTANITTAADVTIPTVPTAFSAVGGFGIVSLNWARPVDTDFAFFEIYMTASGGTAPLVAAVPTYVTTGNAYIVGNISNSTTKNFWLRSVDTSNNKSAWTTMFAATTVAVTDFVTTAAISGIVDATSFAANISPIEIVTTLPTAGNYAGRTVFLTTNSKLYRHTGTPTSAAGFSTAVDGADIVANSITAGQIQAGAIGATEIAANAITASKLFVGDTSNIWHDYNIQDSSLYSSPDGAVITYYNGGTLANIGTRYLRIGADTVATERNVHTTWQIVEPDTDYLIEGYAWIAGTSGAAAELWVEFGTTDVTGNTVTVGQQVLVGTKTTAYNATTSRVVVTAKTSTTEKRFRFIFKKTAAITTVVNFSALIVRRRMVGELVVDGTITATQIAAATITGDRLVANTITATQIAASTITATQIAAATITGDRLVANTITATQIAASTITAAQIAASTITAAQIAASTITAAQIAASTITASKIATGTITATQIAAATITGDRLVANTITATQIAAGTITATQIAANTITATQIAAASITASELAAGSVTATHMLLQPGNMLSNPKFVTGDLSDWRPWNTSANQSVVAYDAVGVPVGAPATNVVKYAATGVQALSTFSGKPSYVDAGAYTTMLAMIPGRKYRITISAAEDATYASTVFTVYIYYRKIDGTMASVAVISALTTVTSTWQEFSGIFTAPADFVGGWIHVFTNSGAAGNFFWTNPAVREMASAELIVDGSITANSIAVGTITATQIAAGTITGAKLVAGTITATQIAAATITASNIAAGTITATQIAANTLTATQIAAGAITASELATGSVTAIKLDTVNAVITGSAQIADAVITNAKIAGELSSTGYTPGVSGWSINKSGTAEFNNLVVRGWIQNNAVSDKLFAAYVGPYAGPMPAYTDIVLVTLYFGPCYPGEIRKYGVAYEFVTNNSGTYSVFLDIRFQYLGVWGPFINKTENTPTTAWDSEGNSFTTAGVYDNVEIRIRIRRPSPAGSGPTNCIKNVYLTCINLVK